MNKNIIVSILLFCITSALGAQNLSLSFFSQTDAKFFVYVNGKLQNSQSSGNVTVDNLEDKEYHVRIVIDDPYEVATTRTLRPSASKSRYLVNFNAVRERVYITPDRGRDVAEENTATPQPRPNTASSGYSTPQRGAQSTRDLDRREGNQHRKSKEPEPTGTTGKSIRTVKTNIVSDER